LPAKNKKIKNKKIMEEKEMEKIRNFFKDESGATMVEYGLMIALIAVVCIGIITTLGENLRDATFGPASNAVAS
jgi:Flp pilus assembly pilin Flp